jgi:hypothetical protein
MATNLARSIPSNFQAALLARSTPSNKRYPLDVLVDRTRGQLLDGRHRASLN